MLLGLEPFGELVDVMRTTVVQMEAFASRSDHSVSWLASCARLCRWRRSPRAQTTRLAGWRHAHDCADRGVRLVLRPLGELVDVIRTTVQKEAFASSCHSVHSASWLTLRASQCELRRSPCCPARRSVRRDNHAMSTSLLANCSNDAHNVDEKHLLLGYARMMMSGL